MALEAPEPERIFVDESTVDAHMIQPNKDAVRRGFFWRPIVPRSSCYQGVHRFCDPRRQACAKECGQDPPRSDNDRSYKHYGK
jgi:hypothetical protein